MRNFANRFKTTYWKFISLTLLFLSPILVAWFSFKPTHQHESSTISPINGQLIQPAADFNQLKFTELKKHPWLILYVTPTPCINICEKNLYHLGYVWAALGKNKERIQRVLLTFPNTIDTHLKKLLGRENKGTLHITATEQQIANFFYPLPVKNISPMQGAFYIVDPLNNLIMAYPADIAPNELLRDLKHLLSTSTVG